MMLFFIKIHFCFYNYCAWNFNDLHDIVFLKINLPPQKHKIKSWLKWKNLKYMVTSYKTTNFSCSLINLNTNVDKKSPEKENRMKLNWDKAITGQMKYPLNNFCYFILSCNVCEQRFLWWWTLPEAETSVIVKRSGFGGRRHTITSLMNWARRNTD